jgi:hypothetical protein
MGPPMRGSACNAAPQQKPNQAPFDRSSSTSWCTSDHAAARSRAFAQTQRRRQPRVTTPLGCCGSDVGPPVAALSTDADAVERRDEYNRRMQQQMGWEDANPYEYHYGERQVCT